MAKNNNSTKKVSAEQSTNGMAIAGFVCSFFVSILGIIFGIIGLNQIKKTGENGKGLAIAGIVIGSVMIALSIIAIIVLILFGIFATNKAIDVIDRGGIDCGYQYEYIDGTYKYTWRCE